MSRNIDFQAYILNTIAFAKTFVVKIEELAIIDNQVMERTLGIPIPEDKSKWRYYLNLNGEYHETDTLMTIKSIDNGEDIPFTKEALEDHPATKRAYREGGYHFSRLSDEYSGQVELIKGIINPIPPEESIPAKNYQILRYNEDYVLWNETQLIHNVQDAISRCVYQTFDTDYLYTEDLMLTILLGKVHADIILEILATRYELRDSAEAHSFYIWAKLNSYGISSIYSKILNDKQTMWLFRNIDYILREAGREEMFDYVMHNLLTERRIPVMENEIIHLTNEQLETFRPEPAYLYTSINMNERLGVRTGINTVKQIINKELKDAIDNESNQDYYYKESFYQTQNALYSGFPIKVLESNVVDVGDENESNLMSMLHFHWIYLTGNGLYNIKVDVNNVKSGRHFKLTSEQAVVLWHYLMMKADGLDCKKVPLMFYQWVRKIKQPTVADLLKMGPKEIIYKELCKTILDVPPTSISKIISPETFYLHSVEVKNGLWDHKKIYSEYLDIDTVAYRKNVCESLYERGVVRVGKYKEYADLLAEIELDVSEWSQAELIDLAWEIWSKTTGYAYFPNLSFAEIQSNLISLMKELSSYSIQFVGDVTEGESVYPLDYAPFIGGTANDEDGSHLIPNDSALNLPLELKVKSEHELCGELDAPTLFDRNNYGYGLAEFNGELNYSIGITPVELTEDEIIGNNMIHFGLKVEGYFDEDEAKIP